MDTGGRSLTICVNRCDLWSTEQTRTPGLTRTNPNTPRRVGYLLHVAGFRFWIE